MKQAVIKNTTYSQILPHYLAKSACAAMYNFFIIAIISCLMMSGGVW